MMKKIMQNTFQRCCNTHEIFGDKIMQILTSPDRVYADIDSQRYSSTKCNENKSIYSYINKFPCLIPGYRDETIRDQEHAKPVFIRLKSRVQFCIGGTKSYQSQHQSEPRNTNVWIFDKTRYEKESECESGPTMKVHIMIISSSHFPPNVDNSAIPRASPPANKVPIPPFTPLLRVAPD